MTVHTLAIVTGASRGLGEAIALQFIKRGTPLVTLARRRSEGLDQEAERTKGTLTQIQADLSDPHDIEKASQQLMTLIPNDLKRCILINNAGTVQPISKVACLSDAGKITASLTLNVTSLMVLTSAVLNATSHTADRRVLNISSGAGRSPMPGWGVYCATKAAVDMYTQVLHQEHDAVRAVALAPGVIDTDMQQVIRSSNSTDFPNLNHFQELHRQGQLASPADTAQHIIRYIDRDDFGTNVLDDIRHYF